MYQHRPVKFVAAWLAILLAQLVLLWGLGLDEIPSILEQAPQQIGNSSLQHSYEPNCIHIDLLHLDLLLLLLMLPLLLMECCCCCC